MSRRMKTSHIAISFVLSGLGLACSSRGNGEVVEAKARDSGNLSPSDFLGLWASDERLQRVQIGQGDGKTLTLEDSYLADDEESYDIEYYDFTSSFVIDAVASKALNDMYLAGKADNGDTVIEHWRIRTIRSPGGGSSLVAMRSDVYRGVSLGSIRSIGVDPDNRFLMILDDSVGEIVQMSLAPGHAITPVLSSLSFLTVADFMNPMQHATEGRLWIVQSFTSTDFLILTDATNDGLFEAHAQITKEQWKASYYGEVWVNDFINH